MNILYEINQTAVRFPDRAAMISGEERLSYGDLWKYSDLLAMSHTSEIGRVTHR